MADTPIVFEPDPVIEVYKKDIDRTLLRENLKLTPEERLRKLQAAVDGLMRIRRSAHATARVRAIDYMSHHAWQDPIIAALGSGVDPTLVTESLRMTPTERLDTRRHAALLLDAMTR